MAAHDWTRRKICRKNPEESGAETKQSCHSGLRTGTSFDHDEHEHNPQQRSSLAAGITTETTRFGTGSGDVASVAMLRQKHGVPRLALDSIFAKRGIPDFLSAPAFDFAWTKYMALIVDKLNLLTAGTSDEELTPITLALKYAKDANRAALFNYASMAFNNHFFFNSLTLKPTEMPLSISTNINTNFSSVETLRQEFIATALGMFGPGFIWVVKADDQLTYNIVVTYLAGSPFAEAYNRRQPTDMNTTSSDGAAYPPAPVPARRLKLTPLLCLNTWEHVWLWDYGVGGKREYVEKWWNRINWRVVADRVTPTAHTGPRFPLYA
ncbi:MAG: hypothetical protein M1826_004752 [Phylliscum demangeonii]|nr:MAG: hypothetical protein M1826_004752 [Phylliscum demangeonii]